MTYRRLVLAALAGGLALQAFAFVGANVGGVSVLGRRMPTITSHLGHRWRPPPSLAFLSAAGAALTDATVMFDDVTVGRDTYEETAFGYELYPRRRLEAPRRTPLSQLVVLARAADARYLIVRRRRLPRSWQRVPGLRELRVTSCCLLAEVEPGR